MPRRPSMILEFSSDMFMIRSDRGILVRNQLFSTSLFLNAYLLFHTSKLEPFNAPSWSPEESRSLQNGFSTMSTITGHLDLNTVAVFGDRQNEVGGFDSSETNARAVVPASVDNEVEVRDHEFFRVGKSLGGNTSVKPDYGEGFDGDAEVVRRANDVEAGAELLVDGVIRTDQCLDSELDHGVVNELLYEYKSGITEKGSTGFEFKSNKEAQAEENKIVCYNADQNAKEDFGDEGRESGRECHFDELADQGAITVLGDENNVKAQAEENKIVCYIADQNAKEDVRDEGGDESGQKCHFDELADQGATAVLGDKNSVKAQAEENKIVCYNADQNAKEDFGDEGKGGGQKCQIDELADQGSSTVLGDENSVKAAGDKGSTDGPKDHRASRTPKYVCQSLDGILHVEAKDVNLKESSHQEFPNSSINRSESLPLGNIQNECHGLNLVVDFNSCSKLVEVNMNMKSVYSEFGVSDLVWGKVRGHPWWPGQIFDPSAASKKAKRYFKKGSYLVAYFGDQTFSWNDASKIKPFQMYFSQMEKQSNLDQLYHAVDCALDEVSRRVEFGLSCPCTPEVFTSLKTQIITNAGIEEHSGRRDGGDRFLNAITFEPKKLVDFVKLLAESPLVEYDILDFAIARAQLLAFCHSKGYSQLSEFVVNDVLVKNDMEILPMDVEEKGQYDYHIDGLGLETDTGYSHKRKHISRGDCVGPCKKHKRLSDLMSEKCLRLPNDKHVLRREADGDESILLSSMWKQKAYENTSDYNCHDSQNIKLVQLHKVSVDEMWWQLCLAATDPTRDGCLTPMVNFFAEFRNFSSPHNSTPLELCKDSYWTDRVIQSIPEEQSLFEKQDEREELLPVSPTEGGAPSFKLQAAPDGKERFDERSKEDTCPAALILEFTNLDSIPSETGLNKIFGRFGSLIESQTELLKKSRRARVVFRRLSDAESAFSSAGKYSIFGPSLFRYHLKVMPSSSKAPNGAGKRGRKKFWGRR